MRARAAPQPGSSEEAAAPGDGARRGTHLLHRARDAGGRVGAPPLSALAPFRAARHTRPAAASSSAATSAATRAPAAAAAPAAARGTAHHGHQVRGRERSGRLLPAPLAPLLPGRLLPRHGPRAAIIGDSRPSLQQRNTASVAAGWAGAGLTSLPVPARWAVCGFWRTEADRSTSAEVGLSFGGDV